MLFRDWGAPRIYTERLERRGLHVNFYPGSVTMTDDPEEMQNTVFYAVFQNHMAEVILQACRQFETSERELWREISRISDEVFEGLASDPEYAEDALRDKEALHGAEAYHKALTRMRLLPEKGHTKKYVAVPNPLHEFHS
jgi:siderophore synthetase component